jgi:phosphohistidine phosphatase
MTKRLTLLRHAKSSWENANLADRNRPLNERGEHDAPLMARRLRQLGVRPSLIVTSPAARALQTVRLFAREINYPLEFLQRESALYLATPAEILAVLTEQDDSFSDLLVCGHNPGLTELAGLFSKGVVKDLPTCGAAVFESRVRSWKNVASSDWTLTALDFPKNPDSATNPISS